MRCFRGWSIDDGIDMLRRAVVTYLRPLLSDYTHTVRHGLAKGLKRKGGFGFVPFLPLTLEERFLRGLDFRKQTVYDVGAWEGVLSLFFSRAVGRDGRVIAFEPQPENHRRILENARLNGLANIEVRQVALGSTAGQAALVSPAGISGEATVREDKRQHLLREGRARTLEVEIDSLDHQRGTHGLPKPDFVKIDVEGLELDVLRGMQGTIQEHKPRLFIELHDHMMPGKTKITPELLTRLLAAGYSIYHVESDRVLSGSNLSIPEQGHLYCT
jgi:FkbM family methyltransferase